MKCPICNTETWCYIVDYPDYSGYICHNCNTEMCEEQTQKIIETRQGKEMSAMMRQRANITNVPWPLSKKKQTYQNY